VSEQVGISALLGTRRYSFQHLQHHVSLGSPFDGQPVELSENIGR